MDKFVINGGKKLYGKIPISGAKNAAVAIIPAVVLSDEPCEIDNLPKIKDVNVILSILRHMGADVTYVGDDQSRVIIDPRGIISHKVTCNKLVGDMRASYYLLGALLGKFGKAEVPFPGGCSFCERPIDLHLKAFETLGAECRIDISKIILDSEKLSGSDISFDVVSVGATMNAMLAAVKVPGRTTIEKAAKEPHVVDLANFLNSMGANVKGAGTDVIKIRGVERLHGCSYSIIPDQIEAGTYMAAVAATGGNVLIENVIPEHLNSIISRLRATGTVVEVHDDSVRVIREGELGCCKFQTAPHPGFPTDMQPQFVAMLSFASGRSRATESVWESRFSYIPQLQMMGADIFYSGNKAIIYGRQNLTGTGVKALDLRAGAAMVIAGLAAKGTTEISDIKYIERGYEKLVQKLQDVGADIKRVVCKEDTSNDDDDYS
ncbi:MAG: UDP-N-acetylglucosamine 1-carboxyvinyltransferase [Clostridia bacterium]|nr:UDP-N-acetylglucosamine 1-carboxyvinyltransferase [Clostridia bacterium]